MIGYLFMRVAAFFMPFFAILAGVCGYFLRLSEHMNVFDPFTGLPERDAATTFWLTVLSLAFVGAVIIFAILASLKHKAQTGFENAFGTDPLAYPIVFIVVGIAWIIGTYMYFSNLNTTGRLTAPDVYFVIFSALAAISIMFFAVEMYQDSRRKAPFALSVIPTIFLCFWLIMLYRDNASNPIIHEFVFQCFALVAAALSFYFTSGFLYEKPAPGKAIITYYAAIYLCAVSLADDLHMGIKIIYIAIIAANIIHSSLLLRNLEKKSSI